MSIWRISGGNGLYGSVLTQGSKNAALPIMAAAALAPCETELLNLPDLRDVHTAADILRSIGCAVDIDGDAALIDSRGLTGCEIPDALMGRMRSSVIFMGALLARCGEARMTLPGGCALGPRPIDLHIMALEKLGARVETREGRLICRSDGLEGARIDFPFPSVGATENAMLAACAAKGRTVIANAAREPEIEDLQAFLRQMGADIRGAGTSEITIDGFSPRPNVGHRVMPDRIAASTLLCAVAAAGGELELRALEPRHLSSVTDSLFQAGCGIISNSRSLRLRSNGRLKAPKPVITGPYPEFPTDAQPLLLAACLKAEGASTFVENVFQSRFRYIDELKKLGAKVGIRGSTAAVTGVEALRGAQVEATDLRGGAALVIAALSAEGESLIADEGHIRRGYDGLDRALRGLGANIEFIP